MQIVEKSLNECQYIEYSSHHVYLKKKTLIKNAGKIWVHSVLIILESPSSQKGQQEKDIRRSLKEVMWYKAGIIRHDRELREALGVLEELQSSSLKVSVSGAAQLIKFMELRNMLLLSEIICRAALLRNESRGAHYRSDYPEEDNANWLKNIVVQKRDEKMVLESIPVSMDFVKMEET